MRPRCPLPIGAKRSTIRVEVLLWPLPVRVNFRSGRGGHVLELHPVADEFGAEPVYFDGLYQREILFSLFGRSDDALYRIAGFETECLDLRRGYVDVVRGVKVVVVGRTEETVTVGHDFQNAFALHETDIGIFRSGSVTVGLPLLVVRGGWLMGSGSSDGLRSCRVLRALRLEGLLYCDGYFRSSCRVGRFCGKRLAGCFLRLLYRFAGPAPPWFSVSCTVSSPSLRFAVASAVSLASVAAEDCRTGVLFRRRCLFGFGSGDSPAGPTGSSLRGPMMACMSSSFSSALCSGCRATWLFRAVV